MSNENVIDLAQRIEGRLYTAAKASDILPMGPITTVSDELQMAVRKLFIVAEHIRAGKTTYVRAGATLYRVAESIRDAAYMAEKLEHMLKKAKKKAKRRHH